MTVQEHCGSEPEILIDTHKKEILRADTPDITTHAL